VCHHESAPQTIDGQEKMIDRLTDWIQSRGLVEPVILFLEASKPLLPIGSQMLFFLQPVLGHIGPMLGWSDDNRAVAEMATLFENPANVDRLLVCLEHRSME
jgi:hypothetical protein